MISCLLFTNRTLEVLVVSIHVYLLLPIFMLLFILPIFMLFYLHVIILPTARRRKVDVRSRSRSRSRLRHLSRILNRMPEPFPIPTTCTA